MPVPATFRREEVGEQGLVISKRHHLSGERMRWFDVRSSASLLVRSCRHGAHTEYPKKNTVTV